MRFLAPAAFVVALLAGPLIALYMLRSRRRTVIVPSLLLWTDDPPDVTGARPWQRLRNNPLLWLQLLVLVLFVVALARPFATERTLLAPHTVLVIDTSASMAMSDRLGDAVDRAHQLVDEADDDQLISLIDAGGDARILSSFSSDRASLHRQLDGLTVTGASEDLSEGVRLARGLATPDRPTSVLLLSDGGSAVLAEEPVAGATHISFAKTAPDRGIATFGPHPATPDSVNIEVVNTDTENATAVVDVSVDGETMDRVEIDVSGTNRASRSLHVDASPGSVMTATLTGDDGSSINDTASFVVERIGVLPVAVTGEPSGFIDALIRSIPIAAPAADTEASITVAEGGAVPDGDRSLWLIRTEPPPDVEITGVATNLPLSFQRPGEPILDDVDLSDVVIAEADIVDAPGWLHVARSGDVPLILLGEVDGRPTVYMTFKLTHSNLPLTVGFPVLGRNIFDHLGGSGASGGDSELAGTPIVLPEDSRSIVTPEGEEVDLSDNSATFEDTRQPGVYRVVSEGDLPDQPAVRRIDPMEVEAGPRDIATGPSGNPTVDTGTAIREWAGWFLGAILVFALLEWWMSHRRPRSTQVPA